jgi:parallel beta-helix repeat protein
VRSGNYTGGILINKPLTLRGENAENTIIFGGATLNDLRPALANAQDSFSFPTAQQTLPSPQKVTAAALEIEPANFIPPLTFALYINCSDVTVSGFTITGGSRAIYAPDGDRLLICQNILGSCILGGDNITVANNTRVGLQIGGSCNLVEGNSGALTIVSSNNTILNNSLTYLEFNNANSNIVVNNTLTGANMGMWIGSYGGACSYNLFAGNKIENSGLWGILMGSGSYNVFFGNLVRNTGVGIGHDGYGLALGGTHTTLNNNLFLRNSFVNNTKNFGANWSVNGTNCFDDGKEGNYWDDYLTQYPTASEVDGSGTGNIPYPLTDGNVDNHPLLSHPNVSDNAPTIPEPWAHMVANYITWLDQPTLTFSSSPTPLPSPSSTVTSPQFSPLASPTASLPFPSSTSSPSVPEFPLWTILCLITATATLAVAFGRRKARNAKFS